MNDDFHVSAHQDSDALLVTVSGELDIATRDRVSDAVAATANGTRECVIDLSGVTFIDASGITGLIECRNHLHHPEAAVTLVGAHGHVERVLRLAGVDEALRLDGQRSRDAQSTALPTE